MSFWDKIQKDITENLKEGLTIVKEGGVAFSQKLEELTTEGKKKYTTFNVNMKVQEEFSKLGGQIYDLINKKSKNPLTNKKVAATINRIKKLEAQITKLEKKRKSTKKAVKTAAKKKRAVRKQPRKTSRKTS